MKSLVHIIPILLFVLALSGRIDARIINVPDDEQTIQAGIDATEAGDTVLVYPGAYRENITVQDGDITIASLFLTTGNICYIDSTVINGEANVQSVVFLDHLENSEITLTGFTIIGGNAIVGGGIECDHSSATLSHLKIVDNEAASGGGIYGLGCDDISIDHVTIMNNRADLGGGIYFYQTDATISLTVVAGNNADRTGGGLYFHHSNVALDRLTVTQNESEGVAGVLQTSDELDILNSIVWDHEGPEMVVIDRGELRVDYSDIEGGRDGITGDNIDYGEHNIDEDPLFANPDEGYYQLTEDSPCIDAGDPDSDPDPDGSRADMGAIPFFHGAVLEIRVLDAEDDHPLEGAHIYTEHGFTARTDENGFCRMINVLTDIEFSLTAMATGYNDSTITGLSVEMGDTLEVIFRLLHPEFNVNPDEIRTTLMPGESTEIDVTIANNGNGPLEWTVRPRGPGGFEPWELRRSIHVGEIVDDSRIEGVLFADNRFYVAGANRIGRVDEPDVIYILNRQGELLDTLPQPDTLSGSYGMRDLAWDGNLIWGSGCEIIAGMNREGEVEAVFDGPYRTNQALAWDPDREALWVSNVTQGITAVDTDGQVVATVDRKGFRVYGLAYWGNDPDGYPLYIFHNPAGGSQFVHKMNPENGDTLLVADLGIQAVGNAGGAFITDRFDMNNWVFIDIANDGARDRIDVWQLDGMTSWMRVEPQAGHVDAGQDQDIDFTIDAADLDVRIYEGLLYFTHNAAGGSFSVPVTLTVTAGGVTGGHDEVPVEFGIAAVYPNPFNSTARLMFTIPGSGHVTLRLYDMLGREVAALVDEDMASGRHDVTVSAEKLATGVYIARLKGMSNSAFIKLVVIK